MRTLKQVSLLAVVLWIAAQLAVALCCDISPQYSDAATYQRLAADTVAADLWYPTSSQLISEIYIFNPGYVNLLVLWLKLFGSLSGLQFFNILLNCVLLICVFAVSRRIAGERCAYICIIFFCLLPSNIFIVAATMSDLFFCFLLFLSLCLFRNRPWSMFLSGMALAAANYVRPIALLFLAAMFLLVIVQRNNWSIRACASFICGGLLLTGAIIAFNRNINGHTIVGGSTGGVNLIMGANDHADGSYNGEVFRPGNPGYINPESGMDVFAKDSLWMAEAKLWIKENPARFIAFAPVKLARLWAGDCYHDLVLRPGALPVWVKVLTSLPYYMIFGLALWGIWLKRRELTGAWGIYLLPVLLACAMHALMYGGMRYHYPFMPILILFASVAVNEKISAIIASAAMD